MPTSNSVNKNGYSLEAEPDFPSSALNQLYELVWKVYLLALFILFGCFKVILDFWNKLNERKNRNSPEQQQARLVIIGGGYAGTFAAMALENEFEVTLIDTKDYFEFTPSRLRTLVEPWHATHIQVPHRSILKKTKSVVGKVESITSDTVHTDANVFPYDYLVICTGSRYCEPVFPTPPAQPTNSSTTSETHNLSTNTTSQQAHVQLEVNNSKQQQILQAVTNTLILSARAPSFETYHSALAQSQQILIVGGGTVGVELAAEIAEAFPSKKVTLVNSQSFLINRSPARAIQYTHDYFQRKGVNVLLGERIAAHEGRRFYTKTGTVVEADMAFMCTGNVPNSDFLRNSSFAGSVTSQGLIRVNEHLQLDGFSNVFVAGDVCDSLVEEKLCQSAAAEVKLIIQNLRKLVHGRPLLPYSKADYPMLVSLGRYDGIFIYKTFSFSGLIPALMKEFVEWKEMVWYWGWSRFDWKYIFGSPSYQSYMKKQSSLRRRLFSKGQHQVHSAIEV